MKVVDRSYFEFQRPEMLDFIPKTASKTIEFGCSNGIFSKMVKEKFGTESWGIDIDANSIKNAHQVLDRAIEGDAMKVLKQLPKEYFDCVICNDFLEHITDPQKFLEELKPYLTRGASLVCSLPNVRHWKNIAELMFEKDWRYRDSGILDKTHLRFFTKKSMQRLMKESGLTINRLQGLRSAKSLRFLIPNIITFGVHNDMKYLQYAIVAKFNL